MRAIKMMARVAVTLVQPITAVVLPDTTTNSSSLEGRGDWPSSYPFFNHWLHAHEKNILYAKCPSKGTNDFSAINLVSIDLNSCFVNKDGFLKWGRGGHALDSCRECKIENGSGQDPEYHCDCVTDWKGEYRWSYMNLNDQIYVDDEGRMACFDLHGDDPQPWPSWDPPSAE